MTNEQIKQNAEKCADGFIADAIFKRYLRDTYIAGAHSRDGEIENLENALHSVNEYCHRLRNKLYQLSNPWISVDDRERMPKEVCACLIRMGEYVIKGVYDPRNETYLPDYSFPPTEVTHIMPIPKWKKGE